MKTPEELNAIKAEVEAMNKKLAELTEEELKQVSGGTEEARFYSFEITGFPDAEAIIKFLSANGWNEKIVRDKLRGRPPYCFHREMTYDEWMRIRNGISSLGALCILF